MLVEPTWPMEVSVRRVVEPVVVVVVPLSLPPRVVAPRLTRVPVSPLRLLLELLWVTCGVVALWLVLELLMRSTLGAVALWLVLELLRLTCGVAALRLILELELLRLTDGALELLERETAADWLLLALLPPCERLRPWAIASDALKIRHPMRAKLIMIFVTEVFIIVMY